MCRTGGDGVSSQRLQRALLTNLDSGMYCTIHTDRYSCAAQPYDNTIRLPQIVRSVTEMGIEEQQHLSINFNLKDKNVETPPSVAS